MADKLITNQVGKIIKIVLNIVAYIQFMSEESLTDDQKEKLLLFSVFFLFFDTAAAFFVLWLIILIPYKWIKRTMLTLQEESMTMQHRKITLSTFRVLNIIKIYSNFRLILMLYLAILTIFIIRYPQEACKYTDVVIIYLVTQSVFCLILYFYGNVQTNKLRQLITLSPADYRKIQIQYRLLMLVSISRLLLNGFFYFSKYFSDPSYDPAQNCSDRSPRNQVIKSVFLVIGELLMHTLPILIVLFIYKPDKSNQSILTTKQNSLEQNLQVS